MSKEFIYVLHTESMPQSVKIGYSNNCTTRLRDINRDNELPFPFKIVKTWEVSGAFKLEQEIHRHLDFCRISNTEYFTLPSEKAVDVINKIINDGQYEFFSKDPSKTMVKITDSKSLVNLLSENVNVINLLRNSCICGGDWITIYYRSRTGKSYGTN